MRLFYAVRFLQNSRNEGEGKAAYDAHDSRNRKSVAPSSGEGVAFPAH